MKQFESAIHQAGYRSSEVGIVIVDHGSRREVSNALLLQVAELARRELDCDNIEPAHMELAAPTVADAFDACVAHGARLVIVYPYFLGPGRHWDEDIPRLARAAASRHAGVDYFVPAPLGLHPLLVEVMGQRISDCLGQIGQGDATCPACDGVSRCQIGSRAV